VQALVLELVDGPTLADRIAQGPIPIEDALPIAKQIAEALEAAHELGIVHRDLKPANIKLRPDGAVKVLDFGLAKMLEATVPASPLTMSPTLSVQATNAGLILGTAPYRSPEQARGRPVDRRTDIWAFGCVLFEMLTARGDADSRNRDDKHLDEPDLFTRRESIAFATDVLQTIKRIAITGGVAVTICHVEAAAVSMTWDASGIVFAERSGGVMRVSANGGNRAAGSGESG
jgi:serine/threonine protein kinase